MENEIIAVTSDEGSYLGIVAAVLALFFCFIGALSHHKRNKSVFVGVFLGLIVTAIMMFIAMTFGALNEKYQWLPFL